MDLDPGLTVAQVAGIIAAGVVVLRLFLPDLLAYNFLMSLREDQKGVATATAARWSVTARLLHSSQWPFFLNSDSAASTHSGWGTLIFTYNQGLVAILVSIAAIVTPLGLYDAIVPREGAGVVEFHYIADPGIFGEATPPRDSSIAWNRICQSTLPCPHSDSPVGFATRNGSTNPEYDASVPDSTVDLFSSGTSRMGDSVSSIFDIEWRFLSLLTSDEANNTANDTTLGYYVGNIWQIGSLALDDAYSAIEGLVVDTKSGGIGLRNHTAPPLSPYGATWTEDLLFLEPETGCINTNLSLEFQVGESSSTARRVSIDNLRLVDNGGFANFNTAYPYWGYRDSQIYPSMEYRAYRGAWWHNLVSMMYMNITDRSDRNVLDLEFAYLNSTLGKRFAFDSTRAITDLPGIYWGRSWYDYLLSTQGLSYTADASGSTLFPNPHNVTIEDFDNAGEICAVTSGRDYANMTNIMTRCGLVWAPARRIDSSGSFIVTGSEWAQDLYSCSSTVRATIKTVTFEFNGTDDLSGLTITDISNKVYPDGASKPLWGVEYTERPLDHVMPLWGLVSQDAIIRDKNITTVQKDSLYLSSGSDLTWLELDVDVASFQNLPGLTFFRNVLFKIYNNGIFPVNGEFDYTGRNSYTMRRRWQELSSSPAGLAKAINLVWTDIAANVVLGTKGRVPVDRGGNMVPATAPVIFYEKRIFYKWVYAIPAAIVLACVLAIIISAMVATILGRASVQKMRRYLNATSAGRLMTTDTRASVHQVTNEMPKKVWIDLFGYTNIAAGSGRAALASEGDGLQADRNSAAVFGAPSAVGEKS
ncbi:hypothetical protein ABW19_dt0203605 [Dactylella cylindrospora]|nr:hypothetical protein ABW19_dt0203605 [Dactylella cylindrospora]